MTMYIGTTEGLFQVNDGAARDSPVAVPITALAFSGDGLTLLSEGRTLVRTRDGGGPEEIGAIPEGLTGRCLGDSSGGVLVGTSNARLLRLGDDGIGPLAGFDAAEGRDTWYTPWGGPPDTRSLSEGPDGTLYANVHVGGILRSRDGGETWQPTIDVDADVHQVVAHPRDPGTVFAATAHGLGVTEDAGDTWRFEADGLHADYCRAVAIGAEHLFLSASRSHRGEQGAVYRAPLDRPGSFERCREGLPDWFDGNVDSHCLAARGSHAAIGGPDGTVFESTDSGATWRAAAADRGRITCVALT